MAEEKIRVEFNWKSTGERIDIIDIVIPKGTATERIKGLKFEYSRMLNVPVSKIGARIIMERQRTMVKALPDSVSVKVQLNGRKRNIIWQALYAKRAQGAYSDRPEDAKALEEIMASMRVIDQYHPVETPAQIQERRRLEIERKIRRS
ncbi:MAG: hypothetical protein PHW62_00720 [Candidatus Ratteibacteria bacterium]|nr:hypothetical protein [Candidatus Ratteibacteria bacterium]